MRPGRSARCPPWTPLPHRLPRVGTGSTWFPDLTLDLIGSRSAHLSAGFHVGFSRALRILGNSPGTKTLTYFPGAERRAAAAEGGARPAPDRPGDAFAGKG